MNYIYKKLAQILLVVWNTAEIVKSLHTVIPRFSAPGRLLIQTVLEGALIRGGRLYV